MKRCAALILVAAGAAGCASSAAKTSAAVPLEIPEPPARVTMAPVPPPEPPLQADRPAPAPPPGRTAPPTVAAPAPAPTASSAPAPSTPVAAAPEPVRTTPAPELQPAGPAGRTPSATQVRDALGRTKQKLDAINPRGLNAGKRADYESARRFLAQAETAVKENNLMLAQSSAEKADALADGLR